MSAAKLTPAPNPLLQLTTVPRWDPSLGQEVTQWGWAVPPTQMIATVT